MNRTFSKKKRADSAGAVADQMAASNELYRCMPPEIRFAVPRAPAIMVSSTY